MYKTINGIQHIGIGVPNHAETWKWYRRYLGMDICFFNGAAEAPLMTRYTKNTVINKQAAMITNLDGGCAMEVVSPISFTATDAKVKHELGDLGIFVGKVKTANVNASYQQFIEGNQNVLTKIINGPLGEQMFYFKDPNGLIYQVTQGDSKEWFLKKNYHKTGGPQGVIIGVSSIDKSMKLYADLLGYSKVVFDETRVFDDFKALDGGNKKFRRVILKQPDSKLGGFSRMTGTTYIELVQAMDYNPKKIYEDRMWGDTGFVHLGFDVRGMGELEKELEANGFPFTCDTNDPLTMGDSTRVHCTYIEDPDGTLIELIEVFRVPIIEKLGVFMNVEKRDPKTPLPNWMLKAMRFSRIKD